MELLIYIAMLSIFMVVVSDAFLSLSRGKGQSETRSIVNSSLRFATEKISQDLRQASSVTEPFLGTPSSSLIMTVSGSTVTYCVSSAKLRRQINGICDDSSETVTSDMVAVTNIAFTRLENTNAALSETAVSITANISARYNSSSPDLQYSADKNITVSLR